MRWIPMLAISLLFAGCLVFGPKPDDTDLVTGAAGTTGTVSLGDDDFDGELLLVEDEALLMRLEDGRIARFRILDCRRLKFEVAGTERDLRDAQRWAEYRSKLIPLARFPAGIPDGVLERILGAAQQDAIVEIGGTTR